MNQVSSRAKLPTFLRLLSNDLRWNLLTSLSRSDYRVQELVALTQEPQNLVSYHLKQLRSLHLVDERRSTADGRDIYYSLNIDALRRAYAEVGEALHPALSQRRGASHLATDSPSIPARRILFLCTENSARSQMAEGILRHLNSHHRVFSAGTRPSNVHPYAVRILAEMGIDISQQRAKSVDEFQGQSFDYLITVCDRARENCPVFPGDSQHIHWSLPDPAAVPGEQAQVQAFEETARQLMSRIRYLLVQMNPEKEGAL